MKRRKLKLEELNRITIQEFQQASKIPLVVVLDNVRSQNNIGSVFRTSDGAMIEKLYLWLSAFFKSLVVRFYKKRLAAIHG